MTRFDEMIHNMLFQPNDYEVDKITDALYDIHDYITGEDYFVDLLLETIENHEEEIYLTNDNIDLLKAVLTGYTTTDKSCFVKACKHETGIIPIVTIKQLIETLNKDIEGEYSVEALRPLCYYISNSNNWIIVDLLNHKVFFMEPVELTEKLIDNDDLWQLQDWLNHHLSEEE